MCTSLQSDAKACTKLVSSYFPRNFFSISYAGFRPEVEGGIPLRGVIPTISYSGAGTLDIIGWEIAFRSKIDNTSVRKQVA